MKMRIVVGISGATGAIYGARLLEVLNERKIESHLIISSTAKRILLEETPYSIEKVERLASCVYDNDDLGADYLKFFTGESIIANQPQLIVTYVLP